MNQNHLNATTPYSRSHKAKTKLSKGDMDLAHKFNALRFLAMNLKSQNDTMNM